MIESVGDFSHFCLVKHADCCISVVRYDFLLAFYNHLCSTLNDCRVIIMIVVPNKKLGY